MATDKRILYHWTHRLNVKGIRVTGLDPAKATGELFAVWGCELQRVEWAKDHVASRHRWNRDDLVLLRVAVSGRRVYRTCWSGVYYTPELVPHSDVSVRDDVGTWHPLAVMTGIPQTNTPA